ncbi:MAG TPA: hypothetical protein VGU02_14875 [Gaiellaceae bacterium]|nr:hypothetical protein [Gaiellaceae bacterium]
MADLESFSADDLPDLGDAIRGFANSARSMEHAANLVADLLWDQLRDAEGEPACALLRVYKTHRFKRLPDDLQAFARDLLDADPPPDTRCLSLLATRGVEPAWNDRRQSEGHKAIPLPSSEFVQRLPMVAGLIEQLGLSIEDVVQPSPDRKRIVELAQRTYDVFHVADAQGSSYVPAQGFVERYGVRSALGFGGVLFTGDFFAVVLFSRVPLSPAVADTVRILSLATRVALMPFGTRVFD